jgi:L-lactate permease
MGFAMGYRGGEGGEMLDVIIMTIFLLVVMMVTGGVDLLYTFFLKCKKLQRVCLITRFSLGALGVGYGFITGRAFSSLAFVAVLLVALGILQLVYMWMQKKGIKV